MPAARMASYADEPALLDRVRELLERVFPGLPAQMDLAAPLGLRWDRCSTPFVAESVGRLIAHVGVMEMRLVLAGEEHRVGVLHAVATDPAERRRGHYRAVMAEVLPWCERRWATLVLNTGQPELYEPFGFRTIPEHRFVSTDCAHGGRAAAKGVGAAAPPAFRALDYGLAEDRDRLRALLAERVPVSRRLGVVGEAQAFAFNEAARPPAWGPDLDVVLCSEHEGTTLRIHDVIARRMPTLDAILARIDAPVDRVECYFAPDLLDPGLAAEPHVLHGEEHLMVRGPFPPEGEPLMLPRPARC
jgi:predicted N-acetyltransferase YhbS